MIHRRFTWFIFFLSLLPVELYAAEPSIVRGKVLYEPCSFCHGANGIAITEDAPHLAHQPALAITYQLIQFRTEQRVGGGMEVIAKNLSDQDARDLGAYIYSLPSPEYSNTVAGVETQSGEVLVNQLFCNSCHGRNLEGQKHVPRLAGQKQNYLEKQLIHFKSGERIDLDGSMENAVQSLDDGTIHSISVFASHHASSD
jgi:cytochrome c553